MKQEHIKWLRRIYGILLSASAVIAGICLIVGCWGIYASGGEQIYTPEKVAQAFSAIAVPVWICLALVIGGLILDLALPVESKKQKAEKNRLLILQRLRENADSAKAEPQLLCAIRAQQLRRKVLIAVSIVLLAVGTVISGIYALQTTEFDHVKTMAAAMRPVVLMLVFLLPGLIFSIVTAYAYRKSVEREIKLWKQVDGYDKKPENTIPPTRKWTQLVPYCVVVLAIGLMIFGYVSGGWQDVLTKAVNICTECVGLG